MCLCSNPAPDKLYEYGIVSLKCGSCPECLRERANTWVLRCVAEARDRRARGESCVMVTLTYDQYLRDKNGNVLFDRVGNPLEVPPDSTKLCNKRDVQLFMKRLRAKFGAGIRYLISAEHGKRTHRAHYHAVLFGVSFDDVVPYKKSKRGNQIYRSKTLEKLWSNGICTVDSLSVLGCMARYVTKYSLKDRGCKDTFQLFSHGIGIDYLERNFTGSPYIIEGREYSIPRLVWQRYIMSKYGNEFPISPRYVPRTDSRYEAFCEARALFCAVRNSDDLYASYICAQSRKAKLYEDLRPCDEARVAALDPVKYFGYRKAWYSRRVQYGFTLDPNASSQKEENFFARIEEIHARVFGRPCMIHLPKVSRQYTANDRKLSKVENITPDDEKIFSNHLT